MGNIQWENWGEGVKVGELKTKTKGEFVGLAISSLKDGRKTKRTLFS